MARVYRVISGGARGKCGCGHKKKRDEPYWLVDGEKTAKIFCDECGKKRKLRGAKVTAEELHRFWFHGEKLKEVVCVKLGAFSKKSTVSSVREEELEAAVEV